MGRIRSGRLILVPCYQKSTFVTKSPQLTLEGNRHRSKNMHRHSKRKSFPVMTRTKGDSRKGKTFSHDGSVPDQFETLEPVTSCWIRMFLESPASARYI